MAEGSDNRSNRSLVLLICALVLCIFLWPALFTFHPGDWPSPNQYPHNVPSINACGPVGAWCAYQLRHHLGDGAYPLLLFMTLAAVVRIARGRIGSAGERIFGLALFVACTSASAHLISGPADAGLPVGHGGLVGFALGELLRRHLDSLGTLIVLASSLFVGLLFATEGWILQLPAAIRRIGHSCAGAVAIARGLVMAPIPIPSTAVEGLSAAESDALLGPSRTRSKVSKRQRRRTEPEDEAQGDLFEESEDEPETVCEDADDEEDEAESTDPEDSDEQDESKTPAAGGKRARKKKAKSPSGPIVRYPNAQQTASAEPYPRQIEEWYLPSLDLLCEPEYGITADREQAVRKQAQILEQTLTEFRLDARVVEIDTGPVITMFELKLGAGIKVSQIATLSNDIARALKAHAIRVVAPISGKNTVGIEVPNTQKECVRLRELLSLAGKKASAMALPIFLGKDAGGAPLVEDLTRMPHMLIAGTTGSGKSVCLNAVIASMLMTKRPDHVKMIVIDPKMVEMSQFKEIPHLMCPIVTDVATAERILEWAVTKMDERYEMFVEARVKNIAGYNSLGDETLFERLDVDSAEERARVVTHLPYIVIIIDELADLMMTSGKEVEHHLSRLAQKSRAVGIHIIVATQRPEARVVTGLIKSNLPSRVCFRVSSRMDSRIVLDQNGGEVLLGQGDMLFLPPGSHKLIRAQGTYLEDSEIHAVLDDLRSRAQPEFHPELVRLRTGAGGGNGPRDQLFDDAVKIILQSRRGSVSLLQRRLTIGYSRASRLIDQMASAGVVGDYKGSQAREVLLTMEEWEALQAQVAADLDAGYEADEVEDDGDGEEGWDDSLPVLSDDHDIRG